MDYKATKAEQMRRSQLVSVAKEREFLEAYTTLADTIDGMIRSQPNVRDRDLTFEWIMQMQSMSATLAESTAKAEGFFNTAIMATVEEMPDEIWKRIGRSSTLTNQYVAGLYSKRFVCWQRLKDLQPVVKTVMDNVRTMLVTIRDERAMHDSGEVRNTDAPFPSEAQEPPQQQKGFRG